MTAIDCYVFVSVLVGVVASLGFPLGWRLCLRRSWGILMLICPVSWLVVATAFLAYGFYIREHPDRPWFPWRKE